LSSKLIERAKKGKFVLVAEIGVNYYDVAKLYDISLIDAAKLMIFEAKKAGVHAVKFQSYKADNLASKLESKAYWDLYEEPTRSQYELFSKYDDFSQNEYSILSSYCKEIDIEFFSTPFDFESADYLEDIMDVYKISSSDLNNHPFINYIAKKNKPILLSVGASIEEEIDSAVKLIVNNSMQPLILLHCVLEYPTPYENANLRRINSLKLKYPNLIIGYSDHTKPDANFDVIKTAYNLGATVIEKHFTLDKGLKGNDHYHSIDHYDAKEIINEMKFLDKIRGTTKLGYSESESKARKYARRSIVSKRLIKAGERLEENMITFKRPGNGISPSNIMSVLGKIALSDIEEDTLIQDYMLVEQL